MKRITDATWQCSGYLQGSSHGETSRGHVTRGQIEAKQRHDLSRHRERFCQPCTRWWRRGAPTLHTSRKAPSCHETRPRVYAVHAVRHHSRRRRRIPGEVSTLHDGQDSRRTWKDRDIALWSYFGTRVHGFVHTYDAVRLTANRDTVRWRIAFPVEKVIKLAALFSMLWMNDISYISSSYLCTPFETFMQGNELF